MTGAASFPNHSQDNLQGSGMPESSRGNILQRGGEELLLEKVADRFVVRPAAEGSLSTLGQQISAQMIEQVPRSNLTEFVVNPAQRDQAMQQARQSPAVSFVSHVYELKNAPGTRVYLTDQITIQFANQVTGDTIAAIAQEVGLEQMRAVTGIPNTFIFRITTQAIENPIKLTNRLMQRSDVLTAEPNIVVKAKSQYQPRDPLYPKQWHLNHNGGSQLAAGSHVFAEQAWDITRGNRAVVVAVMDDSVDLNHPDFQGKGKIVAPRDFHDRDFLPLPGLPDDNHGTACAGVAVAEENGVGAVGVAPGCALMPIRTSGYLEDDVIEELFEWAIQKGAWVISCSWGPASIYFPLSLRQRAALTHAATAGRNGKGCVIVFAAGNSNRPTNGTVNEQGWPNNALQGLTQWLGGFTVHPDVITVSACTSLSKKAAYSNWGAEVSVCAPSNNAPPGAWLESTGFIATAPQITVPLPGLGIFTTDRLGSEGYDASNFTSDFGGTSSACPLVAGVAALVLSANPDLTAPQVKRILQDSADKIIDPNPDPQLGLRKGSYESDGHSDWFGYGKVNAFKAVQAAQRMRQQPAAAVRQISAQSNTALAIPDDNPQGITSTIQISEAAAARDIQVSINLEHTYLGDIEISLIAPSGKEVLLQSRNLGRKTNLQFTYVPQTTPSLKNLLNQPTQGRWQLRIVDRAPSDTGTLKSWQLTLGV
ncbi:MAG: S8 family serine peptidase [Scytolyngbya sp. HA4215-MV1]|jgi:subtilisin family serine protease/subtilisin-like proprotein convertase family protein|nr:S8 family serine peptidase [Scytolyngbya sp. HA4215-MV1]